MPETPDPAISPPPGVPRTTASDTPDTIGAVVQLLRAHEARLTALEARGPDLAAEVARLTAALAAANERATLRDQLRAAEASYRTVSVHLDIVTKERDEAEDRAEKAEAEVARLRSSPAAAVVEAIDIKALQWVRKEIANATPQDEWSRADAELCRLINAARRAAPDAPRTGEHTTSDRDRHAAVVEEPVGEKGGAE